MKCILHLSEPLCMIMMIFSALLCLPGHGHVRSGVSASLQQFCHRSRLLSRQVPRLHHHLRHQPHLHPHRPHRCPPEQYHHWNLQPLHQDHVWIPLVTGYPLRLPSYHLSQHPWFWSNLRLGSAPGSSFITWCHKWVLSLYHKLLSSAVKWKWKLLSVQQSSFYGLTGLLPPRYTQAIMTGESKTWYHLILFQPGIATRRIILSSVRPLSYELERDLGMILRDCWSDEQTNWQDRDCHSFSSWVLTALQDYLISLNIETKTSVVTDTATKNLAAE